MNQARPLASAAGLRWIGDGFVLLWRRPLLWLLLTAMLFAIALVTILLPAIGNLLLYLLSPTLLGVLLLVCHQLAGESPALEPVRAALADRFSPLLALGVAYTMMQLGLLLLLGAAVPGLLDGLTSGKTAPLAAGPTRDALPMLLLVLLLSIPATLMMWFAPALVVFRRMAAWPAMRYSLAACLFHWRAMLVNGMAIFALLLLASLPAMLGLLLWVPCMIGTLYSAYAAIFGFPGPGAGDGQTSGGA
jgi:hypothetical protein